MSQRERERERERLSEREEGEARESVYERESNSTLSPGGDPMIVSSLSGRPTQSATRRAPALSSLANSGESLLKWKGNR